MKKIIFKAETPTVLSQLLQLNSDGLIKIIGIMSDYNLFKSTDLNFKKFKGIICIADPNDAENLRKDNPSLLVYDGPEGWEEITKLLKKYVFLEEDSSFKNLTLKELKNKILK